MKKERKKNMHKGARWPVQNIYYWSEAMPRCLFTCAQANDQTRQYDIFWKAVKYHPLAFQFVTFRDVSCLDLLLEYRTEHSTKEFQACYWLSSRCLMLWINHLYGSPNFWKSSFNTFRPRQNGRYFRRRHFQMHFLELKGFDFDWNFTEVSS